MPVIIKSTSGSHEDTIVQAKNSDDHVFTYEPTTCWVGFGCNISSFTIKGGVNGVYLGKYTNNCKIYNNKIFNNTCGISLDSSSNNTLESNNVSNNDENIHLKNSPNNKINGNNASFSKWDIGICLSNSNYNEITNNTVDSNGWMGISLASSSYNKLVKNKVSNNRESGIDLSQQGGSSNNNTITENNITANGWGGPMGGINVWESNNNKIYLNNFINNTINVQSYESTNIWNSTEELTYIYDGSIFASYLGNYWDDYTEKYPSANEIGSTGIWDTPYGYGMDGDEDNHPLADHFEKYIPTDTEIGTLVVNVYNVNGNPAAEVGGTTSVELIRSGETSTIAEQTIDAESKATFSNVPAGEYYINVRHDPPMEQGDEEFWGQRKDISITTGTTTTIDFYRHTPYVEAFYAEKSPVAIDTPAKINVTIKVPSNYTDTEAHVKTSVIIRDEDGHEVYQDISSSRIVQRGDDTTFSFAYTPTEAGKYYGLAKAYVVGGGELCTDNCGWVEVFRTVEEKYNPKVSIPPLAPSGEIGYPGTTFQFVINVTNGGTTEDVVDLSVSNTEDWDIELSKHSVNLLPGKSKYVYVNITGKEEKYSTIAIKAISRNDISKYNESSISVINSKIAIGSSPLYMILGFSPSVNTIVSAPDYIKTEIYESGVDIFFDLNATTENIREAPIKITNTETGESICLNLKLADFDDVEATNFHTWRDGYNFPNWEGCYNIVKFWKYACCYGMSETSILYFDGKLELPDDINTNDLARGQAEGIIIAHQAACPSYPLWDYRWGKQREEYEKIVGNITKGNPVILGLANSSDLWFGGGHAVVAYKIVNDSGTSFIHVYDPNRPYGGLFNITLSCIRFNLTNNESEYPGYDRFIVMEAM